MENLLRLHTRVRIGCRRPPTLELLMQGYFCLILFFHEPRGYSKACLGPETSGRMEASDLWSMGVDTRQARDAKVRRERRKDLVGPFWAAREYFFASLLVLFSAPYFENALLW